MPRVEATTFVPVPPDVAFALSQTQAPLRYRWDTFVRHQELMHGAEHPAVGVQTFTKSRHGLRMVSEYQSFKPPHQVGMKMVKGPWFFSKFGGGWSFAETEGGTNVTWRYTFAVHPKWLAPIGDRIGTWLLGRDVRKRLDGYAAAVDDPELMAAVEADLAKG
mgnify:CR=1 FL=1